MRSKVTVSHQPMAMIDSFDLISQPLRAASFPSRGSLNSEVRGRLLRVMAPPTQGRQTQKYGASSSEASPLLLTEGGPGGAGCGGDQVRFIGQPGKTIGPTSVSPDGLPPSPRGRLFFPRREIFRKPEAYSAFQSPAERMVSRGIFSPSANSNICPHTSIRRTWPIFST